MFQKSKLIIRGSISFLLLVFLLAGFAACKNPSSSSEPEVTYTVTFNTNGGTPVPDPIIVPAGSKIKRPEDIKKPNNNMGGWYREQELERLWDFYNDVVTEDITLHAKWGTNRGNGGSNSSGRDYSSGDSNLVPAGSAYSQTILFYQEGIVDGHLAHIEISFTHKATLGPAPKDGDSYSITLNDGIVHGVSNGTVQDLGQDIDGSEIYIFIPTDGAFPFVGKLDPDGVLSIDYIHDMNGHYEDLSVSGATLNDVIEGDIPNHIHTTAEMNELDDYIHHDFVHHSSSTFEANPTQFNNMDASDHKISGTWITGYKEGYYGFVEDDMHRYDASYIAPGPLSLYSSTIETGRWIYGEWVQGQSTTENNLHVEIRDSQKSQLQFKGGGAPYTLELDAEYGAGSRVGEIVITASGQTNIVTLTVHLDPGYKMNGARVEWYQSNGKVTGFFPSKPGAPMMEVDKTYTFTGVSSNTTFVGAEFDIENTSAKPGLKFDGLSGGSDVFFVSQDGHGNDTIVIVAKNQTVPPRTVHGYEYDDPMNGIVGSSGWIFEKCPAPPGEKYYVIGGSHIAESQIIEHGGSLYKIEPSTSTHVFYYEGVVGHEYHQFSPIPSDFTTKGTTTMVLDKDGHTFVAEPGGPDREYTHNHDILIHSAKTYDLAVNDVIGDIPVGKVHVEYNRYEPHTDSLTHNVIIPYTLTITYYFDKEYLNIMGNSWDYSVINTNVKETVNGSVKNYAPSITKIGNAHSIIGYVDLSPGIEVETIDITLDFKTLFNF